eukprot:scaffold122241_cov35-Tisochrysis_lutea.AAC.3
MSSAKWLHLVAHLVKQEELRRWNEVWGMAPALQPSAVAAEHQLAVASAASAPAATGLKSLLTIGRHSPKALMLSVLARRLKPSAPADLLAHVPLLVAKGISRDRMVRRVGRFIFRAALNVLPSARAALPMALTPIVAAMLAVTLLSGSDKVTPHLLSSLRAISGAQEKALATLLGSVQPLEQRGFASPNEERNAQASSVAPSITWIPGRSTSFLTDLFSIIFMALSLMLLLYGVQAGFIGTRSINLPSPTEISALPRSSRDQVSSGVEFAFGSNVSTDDSTEIKTHLLPVSMMRARNSEDLAELSWKARPADDDGNYPVLYRRHTLPSVLSDRT